MSEKKTIEQLQTFIALAQRRGFEVRHELLGGIGSALCQFRGRPCLFLDVTCGPGEQLEAIRQTLALPETPGAKQGSPACVVEPISTKLV